jgi:alpha-tubulin suppressor-like RCC1 family protein
LVLRENGTVTTWGQSGANANTVPANNYGMKSIAAGTYHNLAVLTNGNILAWGLNLSGIWNLTDVPANVTNVTAVAAGFYHSLALRADGTVISWGYNGRAI